MSVPALYLSLIQLSDWLVPIITCPLILYHLYNFSLFCLWWLIPQWEAYCYWVTLLQYCNSNIFSVAENLHYFKVLF